MIYLDNSATAFPKPSEVINAINEYFINIGSNPGRGGHSLAKKGEMIISETRKMLAHLFNADNPSNFIFTLNATYAINMILKGMLQPGDHVILTNYEHNSILRPIHKLHKERNIDYSIFESDNEGNFKIDNLHKLITSKTKLICASHGSNVIGQVSPIEEIAKVAHDNKIKLLVDCCQTAGLIPVDINKNKMDFCIFTGHKSLLGPSGIGGFYIKDPQSLNTLIEGGTGQNSHSMEQPNSMPIKFEAGTLNYLGIAGFNASLKIVIENYSNIYSHEMELTRYLYKELSNIEEITLYGTADFKKKLPIISFNIKNLFSNEVSYELDENFQIITRPGLQCSPLIHKTIGTFPNGTIRISLGYKNTKEEMDKTIKAIKSIIVNQSK